MFGFFKKSSVDPWEGAGASDSYVVKFRKPLDELAVLLSGDARSFVSTRFNQRRGCAELHNGEGEIVARIYVEGEMATPTTAVITTNLSENSKKLFAVFMKCLRLEFKQFSC